MPFYFACQFATPDCKQGAKYPANNFFPENSAINLQQKVKSRTCREWLGEGS